MEELTRLVTESMARHGIEVPVDPGRLQWSKWSRCRSSLDLLRVPTKPGLFALAEELVGPGEAAAGKRMLAVFQINETQDLDISLLRLFAPDNELARRLADGRVFVRYVVVEDDTHRRSVYASMQRWLASSAETASGILGDPPHATWAAAMDEIPTSQSNIAVIQDARPRSGF